MKQMSRAITPKTCPRSLQSLREGVKEVGNLHTVLGGVRSACGVEGGCCCFQGCAICAVGMAVGRFRCHWRHYEWNTALVLFLVKRCTLLRVREQCAGKQMNAGDSETQRKSKSRCRPMKRREMTRIAVAKRYFRYSRRSSCVPASKGVWRESGEGLLPRPSLLTCGQSGVRPSPPVPVFESWIHGCAMFCPAFEPVPLSTPA